MGATTGEDRDSKDKKEDVNGMTRLVTAANVGARAIETVVPVLDVRVHA